jgi:hypothetical protein
MHLQVCGGEEKGSNTCACSLVSPCWTGVWQGGVRRWVHAHDVRLNSPSKSGPKPRRSVTSFCRLVLLRVHV